MDNESNSFMKDYIDLIEDEDEIKELISELQSRLSDLSPDRTLN